MNKTILNIIQLFREWESGNIENSIEILTLPHYCRSYLIRIKVGTLRRFPRIDGPLNYQVLDEVWGKHIYLFSYFIQLNTYVGMHTVNAGGN
jgi:hypothetical protein